MMAFACGPLQPRPSAPVGPASQEPTSISAETSLQPATATLEPVQATQTEEKSLTDATATVENPSPAAWSLTVSKKYRLFPDRMVLGASVAARPGKVWIGALSGTIEVLD